MIGVGFTLQPEVEFLELLGEVLADEPDFFEIAPETTWRETPDGALIENGYSRRFRQLALATGCPFVAHGVGLSVGSCSPADHARQRRWLDRVSVDQRLFSFLWYTDHLGVTAPAGQAATLPLPLPMTGLAAAAVRGALGALRGVCPVVGVENAVPYFYCGDPLDEPAFWSAAAGGDGMHLLLDLHNVFTAAENGGFDPDEYLARVDLSRVIEIHVSGGSYSDPSWLPGERVLRLDAHDDAVPDAVFRLLERVAPRCPALRGVTLERMEGTVTAGDVAVLRGELRAIRRIVERASRSPRPPPAPAAAPLAAASPGEHRAYERALLGVLTDPDPGQALAAAVCDHPTPAVRSWLGCADEAGVRLAALLVARLRFERLLRGSPGAEAHFERDPAAFTEVFRRYHQRAPLEAFFPGHEARCFAPSS